VVFPLFLEGCPGTPMPVGDCTSFGVSSKIKMLSADTDALASLIDRHG
jgi:hypothetical protein